MLFEHCKSSNLDDMLQCAGRRLLYTWRFDDFHIFPVAMFILYVRWMSATGIAVLGSMSSIPRKQSISWMKLASVILIIVPLPEAFRLSEHHTCRGYSRDDIYRPIRRRRDFKQ